MEPPDALRLRLLLGDEQSSGAAARAADPAALLPAVAALLEKAVRVAGGPPRGLQQGGDHAPPPELFTFDRTAEAMKVGRLAARAVAQSSVTVYDVAHRELGLKAPYAVLLVALLRAEAARLSQGAPDDSAAAALLEQCLTFADRLVIRLHVPLEGPLPTDSQQLCGGRWVHSQEVAALHTAALMRECAGREDASPTPPENPVDLATAAQGLAGRIRSGAASGFEAAVDCAHGLWAMGGVAEAVALLQEALPKQPPSAGRRAAPLADVAGALLRQECSEANVAALLLPHLPIEPPPAPRAPVNLCDYRRAGAARTLAAVLVAKTVDAFARAAPPSTAPPEDAEWTGGLMTRRLTCDQAEAAAGGVPNAPLRGAWAIHRYCAEAARRGRLAEADGWWEALPQWSGRWVPACWRGADGVGAAVPLLRGLQGASPHGAVLTWLIDGLAAAGEGPAAWGAAPPPDRALQQAMDTARGTRVLGTAAVRALFAWCAETDPAAAAAALPVPALLPLYASALRRLELVFGGVLGAAPTTPADAGGFVAAVAQWRVDEKALADVVDAAALGRLSDKVGEVMRHIGALYSFGHLCMDTPTAQSIAREACARGCPSVAAAMAGHALQAPALAEGEDSAAADAAFAAWASVLDGALAAAGDAAVHGALRGAPPAFLSGHHIHVLPVYQSHATLVEISGKPGACAEVEHLLRKMVEHDAGACGARGRAMMVGALAVRQVLPADR